MGIPLCTKEMRCATIYKTQQKGIFLMKRSNRACFSRVGMKEYIAVFCFTVVVALLLLIFAAFLPQSVIQEHVAQSVDLVMQDFENDYLFDKSIASKLDVFTDTMILRMSLTTNDSYLGSVLTNPVYVFDDLEEWEGSPVTLANLAYGKQADNAWFYTRYWMGFRVVLRLALLFFTYAQIKRYLAFLFLSLFVAVICDLAKRTDSKIAFLFALSIILIRPQVMATSMQLTCCFFIAFIAMLLIPWLHRHPKWEGLFFMELGMLTMYFDFYTVPLVTLGYPLLYLRILQQQEEISVSWKNLFRNMAVWFAGYGLMWVAKLGLTSLLTSEDALGQGFTSFFMRVGISKDTETAEFYSLKPAFDGIREAVFSDNAGMVVYLLGAAVILAIVLWKVLRGHASLLTLRKSAPYLFFAAMPLIWFVITRQPVAIHYFFQYRTIALTHWGAGVFLYSLLSAKSRELTKS